MSTLTADRPVEAITMADAGRSDETRGHGIAEVVYRPATTSVRCECGHWFQAAHRRNAERLHSEHAFRSMVTATQTAGISR